MNFTAHNDTIRKEMLEEINLASVDDLFWDLLSLH
jgi:hypothetical protein